MISISHWGMFFVPVNSGALNAYNAQTNAQAASSAVNAYHGQYQRLNFGELS
jgi:ribosome biogenesis protein Tsr3